MSNPTEMTAADVQPGWKISAFGYPMNVEYVRSNGEYMVIAGVLDSGRPHAVIVFPDTTLVDYEL